MRGPFDDQGQLFSYISPEQRVPTQHPLRTIRELVREVFRDRGHDFRILYFTTGRPSILPEQLLSALLLQVFLVYGVNGNGWNSWTTIAVPLVRGACVGQRGVGRDDLYEESRAIATRRYIQSLQGDAITSPSGHAIVVRRAFLRQWHADRGVGRPQKLQAEDRTGTQDVHRRTDHPAKAYSLSQGKRKMIECVFGWGKQHGTMRKTKYRGLAGVAAGFLLNLIGDNLIRIPKLPVQRG
jgi:hypothetical protein